MHPDTTRLIVLLLAYGLALAGCTSGTARKASMIEVPSPPGSAQPHLSVDGDGMVLMSWIEKVDTSNRALRYASFDGESWSAPQTIWSGRDLFANWADIPKLQPLPDGGLAAHFAMNRGSSYFANDLHVARMSPGGEWAAPIMPHRDSTATQHGFASLVPVDELLTAVWLDGRETTPGEQDESKWGNMALYTATIDTSHQPATLLDDRICDCCPTSAVRISQGALIAYRDRGDDETRDINLIRYDGREWSMPYRLHDDGWTISGCPVNGPALAADGDRVVAAWFTAADDSPKVQVAFSEDGGHTFAPAIVVDDARPKGRVGVFLMNDGSALISWIGIENRQNALKVRRVDIEEGPGTASTIAIPQSPAFTGIPQLVRSGADVYVAWVDGGHPDSTKILLARRPISALK